MRPLLRHHRFVAAWAGMETFAAVLACSCKFPLSLQTTPTETLPPVLTTTQPPPTVATVVPAASVTGTPASAVPIAVTATKTNAPPTITPTIAPPPGGGSWGIVQSDLEPYGVSPVSPVGATTTLSLDVRNYGPHDYQGPVRVVCVGPGFLRADAGQSCAPAVVDINVTIFQGVGTGHFNVDLTTSPACFYPGVQCSLIVPDSKDPNTANNQYGFALP
jgi:hypothetical protein